MYLQTNSSDHDSLDNRSIDSPNIHEQKDLKITKLTPALDVGESPFWYEETGSVLFVDNFRSELHRYVVDGDLHYFTKIGKKYATA